ncbi:hypothetical protein RQP46_006683 [Phenoliferia psychrophenolica]
MSILEQQKNAALGYIASLNAWDFEGVKNRLSDLPEFKYEFRPASLHGLGAPNGFNKDKLIEFMHHLHDNIVKEFNFQDPHEFIQETDKSVVWISTKGRAHDNSPYTNEYTMILRFEPGTDKFLNVTEMMDSLFITDLQADLKKKHGRHQHNGKDCDDLSCSKAADKPQTSKTS